MEKKFKIIYRNPITHDIRDRIYTLDDLTSRALTYSVDELYEDFEPIAKLMFSGYKDREGTEIYEGDIIELINEDNKKITVDCGYGRAVRQIMENQVELHGFYFMMNDGRKTFPIINNYAGRHDLELFKVVGNRNY